MSAQGFRTSRLSDSLTSLAALAILLLGLMASAMAQEIPPLADLPASVAKTNPDLAARRTALAQERTALHGKIDSLNARCAAVEEGSAAEASCKGDQVVLVSALNSHIDRSKEFNVIANRAILASAATSSDASVVDARNVPSGLPESVDNAITSVYAKAPLGVSDRVRKGFQAVMTRDWKVAKAWFEDALNRDPGNAGLRHLVELSNYTEQHIHPGNPAKSSSVTPVQFPTDSDMEYLFPDWQPPNAKPPYISPDKLPKDTDIEFLFPDTISQPEAKELNDYMFDQALKMTENDPVLRRMANRLDHAGTKP